MTKRFCSKKFGFTLSEVLLTITLIGFLATMTLSTVGASVQQRARMAEFRTAYAKLDSTLRNIMIDDSKIYYCYKTPSSDDKTNFKLDIKGTVVSAENSEECQTLTSKFVQAMGLTRTCSTNPIDEGCIPSNYPEAPEGFTKKYKEGHAYVLDNSMILFDNDGAWLKEFAIDINGRKGPNKWGQDIFPFALKAFESKIVNGNTVVTNVKFLPADVITSYGSSKVNKTTLQMMKESAAFKN